LRHALRLAEGRLGATQDAAGAAMPVVTPLDAR
jgi:hypothetical protein